MAQEAVHFCPRLDVKEVDMAVLRSRYYACPLHHQLSITADIGNVDEPHLQEGHQGREGTANGVARMSHRKLSLEIHAPICHYTAKKVGKLVARRGQIFWLPVEPQGIISTRE